MIGKVGESSTKIKVLCIVDYVRKKGRYCYWKDRLKEKTNVDYEEISLPEMKEEAGRENQRRIPRFKNFQVIICNYDVANGGYEYDSDTTLTYFTLRGTKDLKVFTDAGGRFICEVQATGGAPIQASYDAIFGRGELSVMNVSRPEEIAEEFCSKKVVVNLKRKHHPILEGLDETLESKYKNRNEEVFPGFMYGKDSVFAKYSDIICWGWFTEWKKGWIPLLLISRQDSNSIQHPVMLVKRADNGWGEYVATTMRIANSEIEELIDNLVTIKQDELINFYKSTLGWIKSKRIALCVLTNLIALGIITGLGWLNLFGSNYPKISLFRDVIDLVFGPAFVGVVALVLKFCKWIWDRPFRC